MVEECLSPRLGRPGPSWQELREKLSQCALGSLTLNYETLRHNETRRYRVVDGECSRCVKRYVYQVDNILGGKTMGCRCTRGVKYGLPWGDVRVRTLGTRYDSMVQRCRRDTHVSSHNYKGRGIEVRFKSRAEFIWWALTMYPDTDYKGLDFDRIDNEGHYEPGNLRLVTRSVNLRNRRKPTSTTS